MHKKIGILTIYDLSNYGNRLQNYASVKYLEIMGIQADSLLVDYKSFTMCAKLVIRKLRGAKPVKDCNLIQESTEHISLLEPLERKRYELFREFTYKYIPPSYYKCLGCFVPLKLRKYDAFLVGSDQVWNPNINQAKEWAFLGFAPRRKRIAWCASFGCDNITDKNVICNLNKIYSFSVREEAGAKIIKDLTGRDATVLVDPTMLLTQEEWRKVSKKPIGAKEGYILTYFLSPKCDEAKAKLEENRGDKEVYELLNSDDKVAGTAGPSEFLWLFDHADLILTDSFHACVFSFLFNKPFIVYDRNWDKENMNSRLETLLSKFHLERKYVNSGLDNDIWEHDYSEGYVQLEIERQKAVDFLKKALED